ncbi:MAG: hypothetical protein IT307_11090 [Chloroflexi bacterium]|nr:hypothetical protein [Chloroflexota bacterium]
MNEPRSARSRPQGETAGSPERPARRLAGTALSFDLAREIASLKEEASWQRGDRNACTLLEEAGLRILLTVARAGTRIREHRANGWVSIQTLEGSLRIATAGDTSNVPSGCLLTLEPEVRHDVEAIEESAFLVTIAWPAGEASRGSGTSTWAAQQRSSASGAQLAHRTRGAAPEIGRTREYRVLRMEPLIGDDRLDPRTQPGAGFQGSSAGPDMEAGREFEGQVVTEEHLAGMGRLRWESDRAARLDTASESYRVEVEPLPPSGP